MASYEKIAARNHEVVCLSSLRLLEQQDPTPSAGSFLTKILLFLCSASNDLITVNTCGNSGHHRVVNNENRRQYFLTTYYLTFGLALAPSIVKRIRPCRGPIVIET